MFLGFEDSLKTWKKDLKAAGTDMSVIKEWQKTFDKVKRQVPQIESQYIRVKSDLETVYTLLQNMERDLVESKTKGVAFSDTQMRRKIVAFSDEMKKYQKHFNHEFLISQEDTEFHLTYKTLLQLCGEKHDDGLILQSEVENLMAITKEALGKELPSFRALAFYYLERSDDDIYDIPHADKVEKVNRIYENEFLKPMRQILASCYGNDKANHILEAELWT